MWKNKSDLIQVLDTPDGISEFLIPLLYGNYINELTWVRPKWSLHDYNIDGNYLFFVGDCLSSNTAGSTLKSTDYVDDENFYDIKELDDATIRNINISIITADSIEQNILKNINSDWILDICYDFFSVSNPFLPEFIAEIGQEQTDCIIEMYQLFSYRKQININNLTVFEIKNLYLNSNKYLEMILNSNNNNDSDIVTNFLNCFDQNDLFRMNEIIPILQNMSINAKELILKYKYLVTLPHHISSNNEIDELIQLFISYVKSYKSYQPNVITLCRSANDSYTPPEQLHYIESQIMKAINEDLLLFWGKESKIELKFHDLSINSEYIASTMFINHKIRDYIGIDETNEKLTETKKQKIN